MNQDRWEELRARAVAALAEGTGHGRTVSDDVDELIQELRIYQAELELQNADLLQAQLDLEASRNRYRELFDRGPVCYFLHDPDGILLDLNDAGVGQLGAERAILLGKPLSLYVMPGDHAAFLAHRQRVLTLEARDTCELAFRRRDGATFHGRVDTVLLPGAKPRLLSVVVDISSRRLAEMELESSEERYRALFERSRDAILVFDAVSGAVLEANPAARVLTGLSSSELVGAQRTALWPPDRADDNERIFAAHLRDPEGIPVELGLRRLPDGEVRVEVSVSVVEAGGRVLLQATLRDVTERHRARREQLRLEEQLRQSQKMEAIGRLAGQIAHDMNNVLGAILGVSAVLQEELDPRSRHFADDTRHREDVGRIMAAARRGRQLTTNLLGFARRGGILQEPIAIEQVVGEVTDLLARTTERAVTVSSDVAGPLPAVMGDPGQLSQMLLNLCLNAIDARAAHIAILARSQELRGPELPPGRYVVIDVVDDGDGMDGATLERVFEPFFTTKPKGKGTGLGLAMVYGVARNHAGDVRIASRPGQGTTVTVVLPASEAKIPETPVATRRATRAGLRRTVLIIDDEPLFRQAARRQLELLEYEVIERENGADGLAAVPDLERGLAIVLLDLDMPGMNGVKVLEVLRRDFPELPVLVCSGYSQERLPAHALTTGKVGFIRKPFEIDELADEVRRLTGTGDKV